MTNDNKPYKRSILDFGQLRAMLRERGITELQLARMIGEKVAVVRNIQLNAETTSLEVIRKICEALQCEPGDIMKRTEMTVIPAKQKDSET